jgi:glycine dehydrogenase subunit 2
MLVEPTETETKATLDGFVESVKALTARAKAGDVAYFHEAPRLTPRRRLDETTAARNPILRWRPTEVDKAAE